MESGFSHVTRALRKWLLAGALLALAGCASVPELGQLADPGTKNRTIIVRLDEQKAYLLRKGKVVSVSSVSTGREGYATPAGKYRVIQKDIDHRSTLYGAYVKNGRVVKANVNVKKDRKPAGAVFVGAPMPYFLRINGAVGLHAGHVPGYPASHGCIRLPPRQARRFYHAVEVGTPVIVYR
jgi:lipoprotein-anchoring transpeptidase ErfK/SrfK